MSSVAAVAVAERWGLVRRAWSKWPARALVLFTLLALPWPGVPRAYTTWLAGSLGLVLGEEGPPVSLSFRSAPQPRSPWGLEVRATELDSGRTYTTNLQARRAGYVPSAVLFALLVTSRLTRRRKALALGIGFALLQLLPVLPVLAFFSGRMPVVAFELGTVGRVAADLGFRLLVAPLGMAYAVPALLALALVALLTRSAEPVPAVAAAALPGRVLTKPRSPARRGKRRRSARQR